MILVSNKLNRVSLLSQQVNKTKHTVTFGCNVDTNICKIWTDFSHNLCNNPDLYSLIRKIIWTDLSSLYNFVNRLLYMHLIMIMHNSQ